MSITIERLRDTFKISKEAFAKSRAEALLAWDLYDNNQYTAEELCILENRGQPKETFNIIKMFSRLLIGYYSTVVTSAMVTPRKESSTIKASILNDVLQYVFKNNSFNAEGDKIKLDCLLTGLMAAYVEVIDTGNKDEFGRIMYEVKTHHVPSIEIMLDPMSKLEDNSDARFTHRFKWLDKQTVKELFPDIDINKLNAYQNTTNMPEAEFEYTQNTQEFGEFNRYDSFLIIHTVIKDEEDPDTIWSVYWSDYTILSKEKVSYRNVKNPYRIHKLHSNHKAQYYGIFHDVLETQRAINQALLKIQLMVNTEKAFVQDGAVEDLNDFKDAFYRVNAIIPVRDISGIKIENLSAQVLQQYTIIDRALDRIQRVLSINDSFLGMAYASDSGAKVQLQQNASMVALRYVTLKVEQFYKLLGTDIVNLVKQFYNYHDVLRIADDLTGQRFVEINRPIEVNGNIVYEEAVNQNTGEPLVDDTGNIIMIPIATLDTEIDLADTDVDVDSVAYDNDTEKTQSIMSEILNGPSGQFIAMADPAAYLKIIALAARNIKFKYSSEVRAILEEVIAKMTAQEQMMLQQSAMGQQQPPQQLGVQMPGRASQGRG